MRYNMFQKKWLLFLTLGVFVFGIIPAHLASQVQLGNVMGFVYKNDGKKPFKDCTVILQNINEDEDDKQYKSEPTGDAGDYRIYNLPSGVYKAAVKNKAGRVFYPLTVLKVMSGKTVIRSFYLVPRTLLGWIFPCGIAMVASGTAVALKIFKKDDEKEVSPTQR